jgi:alkyl hydroperoxide reductase subunit AhpC
MRRIGDRALPFRLPAVADAGVTFIDPVEFLGRWVVLSFVPSLEEFDMDLWDAQGRNLQAFGAALLLVPLEARGLHSRFHSEGREHFTIVGDPLGRLQRLYGARTLLSSGRARTFLVDPDGRLRFHVLHSLSDQGMGVIMEVLHTYQSAEIPA